MLKYFSVKMCRNSLFNFDVILKCLHVRVRVFLFFKAVTINDLTLVLIEALHLCAPRHSIKWLICVDFAEKYTQTRTHLPTIVNTYGGEYLIVRDVAKKYATQIECD